MTNPSIEILFEDAHILVCIKPAGVATQSKKIGSPDMVSLLKNHIHKTNASQGEPYLAVIHRLDQPVSGILVFAKTPFAAKELNKQLQNQGFGKYYRALVDGIPDTPEGILENFLVKDARTNTSRICSKDTPNAKLARLHYKTVEKGQGIFNLGRRHFDFTTSPTAELDIHLDTGRHHQIRVQLAGLNCPIVGDAKYNPNARIAAGRHSLCLCAYRLEFTHPKTYKPLVFQLPIAP